MKRILFTLFLFLVISITNYVAAQNANVKKLNLQISQVEGFLYTTSEIPVNVFFENPHKEIIRLLNKFDNKRILYIFFRVHITDIKGNPIPTRGGGKIAFRKKPTKYIELEENEKYTVKLNLQDFLHKKENLKEGAYKVRVEYFNQYGENCFTGRLKSSSIYLNLTTK